MGRRSKLTPETHERIVDAIKMGATYELAAQAGGASYETFRRWMRDGEEADKGQYCAFYVAVKEAEGKACTRWLKVIEKAGLSGQWQAAAWKLERRYPGTFGRRIVQNEVTGKDGANLFAARTDEELKAIALAIANTHGGDSTSAAD